ncbi:hypothetical protein LIS82_26665 (plasmid) [Cytobacillus solani]|uniref:hypothetical protein n=1 Tax=Cytobacillus solani TaxID=1637975 RepID=UPI002079D431|nr:hypothetical protein [Cytobacillus solani]USK57808.1 hypothetical protein LIS82_26665 [Cytobacillus solani]
MKEAASIVNQIETLLRDFYWMKKEVNRLQKYLYGRPSPMRSWGVAQYGLDVAMPKGISGKSQMELRSMDIREDTCINVWRDFRREYTCCGFT